MMRRLAGRTLWPAIAIFLLAGCNGLGGAARWSSRHDRVAQSTSNANGAIRSEATRHNLDAATPDANENSVSVPPVSASVASAIRRPVSENDDLPPKTDDEPVLVATALRPPSERRRPDSADRQAVDGGDSHKSSSSVRTQDASLAEAHDAEQREFPTTVEPNSAEPSADEWKLALSVSPAAHESATKSESTVSEKAAPQTANVYDPAKSSKFRADASAPSWSARPPVEVGAHEGTSANEAGAQIREAPTILGASIRVPAPVGPNNEAKPSRAPLTVARLAFCRQIHGFGEIEPVGPEPLKPGQSVLLYVELRHFTSTRAGNVHRTSLASRVVLVSPDGNETPVTFQDIVDHSATQRNDFFCHYHFVLPQMLAEGRHELRLRIKDLESGEAADTSLSFAATAAKPAQFDAKSAR